VRYHRLVGPLSLLEKKKLGRDARYDCRVGLRPAIVLLSFLSQIYFILLLVILRYAHTPLKTPTLATSEKQRITPTISEKFIESPPLSRFVHLQTPSLRCTPDPAEMLDSGPMRLDSLFSGKLPPKVSHGFLSQKCSKQVLAEPLTNDGFARLFKNLSSCTFN
jgi:hypothetical protein